MEIIAKVKEVIKPALEKHNVNLYDVEFVKDNNDWFLRIYIENEDGTMDLDTCVDVSQDISIILDNEDPIDHIYVLEVSSPGAERPLLNSKHIEDSIGKYVSIIVKEPVEGYNELVGNLIAFDGEILDLEVKIKTRVKVIKIAYDNVEFAHLAVKF